VGLLAGLDDHSWEAMKWMALVDGQAARKGANLLGMTVPVPADLRIGLAQKLVGLPQPWR